MNRACPRYTGWGKIGHLFRNDRQKCLVNRLAGIYSMLKYSLLTVFVFLPTGCDAAPMETHHEIENKEQTLIPVKKGSIMNVTVNGKQFSAIQADTEAGRAFFNRLPLEIQMEEYNGNEKHGSIVPALPPRPARPGMIHNGDILLWGNDTVVIFYRSFRSPYSYTRLGHIENAEELPAVLGIGNAVVRFSNDKH